MERKLTYTVIMVMATILFTQAQENNNFYDDAETYRMEGPRKIEVRGEVVSPGYVDLEALPLRSVIVKEAVLASGAAGDVFLTDRSVKKDTEQTAPNQFIGAYRYDGYSLFDILSNFLPDKKNKEEFNPVIDLYVEVIGQNGESVVLSWGEIYYPVHLHEIIIATSVMRIVPSKTKELWPIPGETRLIVGHDLLTERNISSPAKIIVHSADRTFKVIRELTPLFSPSITYYPGDEKSLLVTGTMDYQKQMEYESVFYGRGRGIHSTTPFTGPQLKEVLSRENEPDVSKLRHGYFVIAATDGYRCVYSYSEIFNRNDQAEFLLIEDRENMDGGAFRLFPAADFFSDRAIKAISEIRFEMTSQSK